MATQIKQQIPRHPSLPILRDLRDNRGPTLLKLELVLMCRTERAVLGNAKTNKYKTCFSRLAQADKWTKTKGFSSTSPVFGVMS